jgi:hypothetical protein
VRFLALLFPTTGFGAAIYLISSCAILGKSDLEKAHRAKVLFMVVRSNEWRPRAGEDVRNAIFRYGISEREGKGTSLLETCLIYPHRLKSSQRVKTVAASTYAHT